MPREATHPVRTLEKTLAIMEALKERRVAGVTELAESLEFSKSVVHNHLRTLEEHEYVRREADGYRLGLKFLDYGGEIRNGVRLYNHVGPEINKLTDETGELVSVMTEEFGEGVYLYRLMGEQAVGLDTYAGYRVPIHCTAPGKAILASLPDERVDAILEQRGLPAVTPHTITDEARLREELERIRNREYATDDGERVEGLRCVAAPVQARDGEVLGAISIAAPTSRLRGARFEAEIPEHVLGAVNVIELRIQHA
jgi:DNA-binding IclR family transcriptional regulator